MPSGAIMHKCYKGNKLLCDLRPASQEERHDWYGKPRQESMAGEHGNSGSE